MMCTNVIDNISFSNNTEMDRKTSSLNLKKEDIQGIISSTPSIQSLQNIRKLSMNELYTQPIIESGIIDRLNELLDYTENELIQYESAWIITNIAAGDTKQCKVVLNCGAHYKLIKLIHHHNIDICHTAIEGLGNITGDCQEYRDELLNLNILDEFLKICSPMQDVKLLRSLCWVISGMCRIEPSPESHQYLKKQLKLLSMLLFHDDDEILTSVCWSYCHLLREIEIDCQTVQQWSFSGKDIIKEYRKKAEKDKHQFDTIINHWERKSKLQIPSDLKKEIYRSYAIFDNSRVKLFKDSNFIISQSIYLLDSVNPTVKHAAIVCFGNMQRYMNETEICQLTKDYNILDTLYHLTHSERENIRRDCFWVISNLIVTIPNNTNLIINSKLLLRSLEIIEYDNIEVGMEAIWAVGNSVDRYHDYCIDHGIMKALLIFIGKIRKLQTIQFVFDIIKNLLLRHIDNNNNSNSIKIYEQMKEMEGLKCINEWIEKNPKLMCPMLNVDLDNICVVIQLFLNQFEE